MTYAYACDNCKSEFEVWKSITESSRQESCKSCNQTARRIFTSPQLIGTSVYEANYNPGLGKVIHSKTELNEHCKRNGLIEVGNENPAKHIKPPQSDWSDV